MPELLRTVELCHRFRDGHEALDHVNFSISEGEVVILAGRNGSGKTLLARHLAGLTFSARGSVLFRGAPIETRLRELRRTVGYVFQDTDSQILGQTVGEDVAFGPSNMGLSVQEIENRVRESLAEVKLAGMETRRPETLSGGERRRLAIAGALAARPACLILDEPFANLDYESILDALRICRDLRDKGITLLIVTHEIEKVLYLAGRLVVLDRGSVCFDGQISALKPDFFTGHGLAFPFEGRNPWSIPAP